MGYSSPLFWAREGFYPEVGAVILAILLHGLAIAGGFYFSKTPIEETKVLTIKEKTIMGLLVTDTVNKSLTQEKSTIKAQPQLDSVTKKKEALKSKKTLSKENITTNQADKNLFKDVRAKDIKKEPALNTQEIKVAKQELMPSEKSSVEAVDKPKAPAITKPVASAAHLNNAPPIYPRRSLHRKEEGTVWLLVFITKDGNVSDVRLKKTSGYERLDQAALEAVQQWRYIPARQDNQAIDYWHEQPVVFNLRG